MPQSQFSQQVIRDYLVGQGLMLPDRTIIDALAIYRAAVEYGVTSAELGNVLGISGPQVRDWIVRQGLPPLPADADMGVSYVLLTTAAPAPPPPAPAPAVVVTTVQPAPAPVAPPPPSPAPAPAVVVTTVQPAPASALSRAEIIARGWMRADGTVVDGVAIYQAAASRGVTSDALGSMLGLSGAEVRNWIVAQGLPPLPADSGRGVTYTRIPSPPPPPPPPPPPAPAPSSGGGFQIPVVSIAPSSGVVPDDSTGGASLDLKTVGIAVALIGGAMLLRRKG